MASTTAARRLRTAGAVKICHWQTVVQAVQGGKIRAGFVDRGNWQRSRLVRMHCGGYTG